VWDELQDRLGGIARQTRDELYADGRDEVLLGFPAAPFVLTMTTQRPYRAEHILSYARTRPTHPVRMVHRGGRRRAISWEIEPADGSAAYRLYFNLPANLDQWITGSEHERMRARMVEEDLLSTILIYRVSNRHTDVFRLQYSPHQRDSSRS
jgi:hypothetical protein